jgi:hypothetical protein
MRDRGSTVVALQACRGACRDVDGLACQKFKAAAQGYGMFVLFLEVERKGREASDKKMNHEMIFLL